MTNHEDLKKKIDEWIYSHRYIKLNENGIPTSKAPYDNTFKLTEIISESNIAMIVPQGYIALDIDDKERSGKVEKFLKIIDAYQWKCNVLKTDSGIHVWFKCDEIYPNSVDTPLPIGINSDIRSGGKKGMLTIKKKTVWRPWIRLHSELDYLPKELKPFWNKNDRRVYREIENPYNLSKGSRRDNLFKRVRHLRKLNWTDKEIMIAFLMINKFFFNPPISEDEIAGTLYESNKYQSTSNRPNIFFHDSIDYDMVADLLIQKFKFVFYANNLYFYNNEFYEQMSENDLKTEIRDFFKINNIRNINNKLRSEVLSAIIENKQIKKLVPNNNYLCLKNGLLNLENLEIEPFSESIFTVNKIDVIYDKNANEPIVMKFLEDLTLKRENLIKILLEFWGYCLSPYIDKGYGKALILYGSTASNGKSTFIEVMSFFFGKKNISSLSFDRLNERFSTAQILGKMINTASEIRSGAFNKVDTFKMLITGDSIEVEKKNKDPFTLYPTTKFIFATNEMPQITERGEGVYRRLLLIPFENKFTPQNGMDNNITEKLTTQKSLSTFLNLAIEGKKRLNENKQFTSSNEVKEMTKGYIEKNSTVITFINYKENESETDTSYFDKRHFIHIYNDYKIHCKLFGAGALKFSKFKDEFLSYLGNKFEYKLEKTQTRTFDGDEFNEDTFIIINKK